LGAMGSRMARNLVAAGHAVTVWNRSPDVAGPLQQAGAEVGATPRDAAKGADVVISMVRDDAASRFVWTDSVAGALHGMAPDAIAVESSTLSHAWVMELAQRCAAGGIGFLDAPVLGSRPQAEAGQLIYLVGGQEDRMHRVSPVLKDMGASIHHVGGVGAGAALKLLANAFFGIQVVAVAELCGLVQACGFDAAAAFEIFSATPLMSPAAKGAVSQMLSNSFAPLFPVDLIAKDLHYLQIMAMESGARFQICDVALEVFIEGQRRGLGAQNLSAVVQLHGPGESLTQCG
ncbi:MAG: NAD(P)-dependent oxidoreductase, partial [Rhodocyclaceae bacterium]|nr:NAD(P)-dependent oxidoreductase [Rhodocyclaceae bacterium]